LRVLYRTLLVLLIVLMSASRGFAGMRLTAAIDSDTLSPDDAAALRDLIHAASFFDLPAKSRKSPSGADRFRTK